MHDGYVSGVKTTVWPGVCAKKQQFGHMVHGQSKSLGKPAFLHVTDMCPVQKTTVWQSDYAKK
jgi:hypothetical protein